MNSNDDPLTGPQGRRASSAGGLEDIARAALARGDLDEVIRLLGRPHALSGVVVRGAALGRTIGFPTCNLAGVEEILPPLGVYAVRVDRELGPRAVALAEGVANVGVRPTVDAGATRPSVEVHLFDVNEDLYGARLRVHLVARLRPEQRFANVEELRAQIARDATDARERLAAAPGAPADGGAFYGSNGLPPGARDRLRPRTP